MRNFIRNIIDRLLGLIHDDTREPIGESVAGDAIPVPDERSPGTVTERFDRAALTPEGIRLHGFRYQNAALTGMLSRMSPGDTVKVKIPDPDDASSIQVWNGTARPRPEWITVAAIGAEYRQGRSFWQHERVREFAKTYDLAFSTDEEWSEAREHLRKHWERLTEFPPLRERRLLARNVGLCGGPVDDDPLTDPSAKVETAVRVADEKLPKADGRASPHSRRPSA